MKKTPRVKKVLNRVFYMTTWFKQRLTDFGLFKQLFWPFFYKLIKKSRFLRVLSKKHQRKDQENLLF